MLQLGKAGRLMVVSPHQDDEVIGCGGLIGRCSDSGWTTRIVSLGLKPKGKNEVDWEKVANYRAQLEKAMNVLVKDGIYDVVFGDFMSNLFYEEFWQVLAFIHDQVRLFEPTLLAIPWEADLHQDHKIASIAGRFAGRAVGGHLVETILIYETASCSEQQFDEAFAPNVFLPLPAELMDRKTTAMAVYLKELHDYPHPRSTEGLVVMASYRGMQVGTQFAEAFKLYRGVL